MEENEPGAYYFAHLTEQAETAMPMMARLLGAFYQALIAENIPEEFVQALVIEWFIVVLAGVGE